MIVHEIRDIAGNLVALHERKGRWLHPDGTPSSPESPVTLADKLYGLEQLAQRPEITSVVIVEGEKAADALRQVGFLALGTFGAGNLPSPEVLKNLQGRMVTVWADNDGAAQKYAGQKHMQELALSLHKLGIKVRVAEWPGAPPKGDAADLVNGNGTTPEEVRAALKFTEYAPPVVPGRPTKLQVERTDPPTWLVTWPEAGIMRLNSAQLQIWGKVQTQHLDQFLCSPAWQPGRNDTWTDLVNDLESVMTDADYLDPPPELTTEGRVLMMLVKLLGTEPPTDPADRRAQPSNLDRGEEWWELDEGRVWFRFAELIKDHHRDTAPGDRIQRSHIRKAIEQMGGQVSIRKERPGPKGQRWQPRLSWLPWGVLANQVSD